MPAVFSSKQEVFQGHHDFLPVYTKAITRKPGRRFEEGLTSVRLGKPDYEKALEQHAFYCSVLEELGLEVVVLEADERYPDGCFVEDTAVVTKEVVVITRPGDASRQGEEEAIASLLGDMRPLERIVAPGCLDGGDVMRLGSHFYIGLSGRTNREGARQLAGILSRYGYTTSEIPVEEVLHLKTGITPVAEGLFVGISSFAERQEFRSCLLVSGENAYAANCLYINGDLLMPAGFSEVREQLEERGVERIKEVPMSEFRKMDGGLTCLSLLLE